jgi:dTDP-4-dehydrorhamnose reductase
LISKFGFSPFSLRVPDVSPSTFSCVWVTGAGGLIGRELVRTFVPGAFDRVIGLTRADLDLTRPGEVCERFLADRPAAVIHAAAMSKSPACQANPAAARRANVEATRFLTDLAAEVPFVFYSTDLVFDGQRGGYVEDDAVNPLSVYAETKVEAEAFVRLHSKGLVIRTSLNHGTSPTRDRAFNEEMSLAWRSGRTLSLFEDEYRCPIPAEETARATWELLAARATGILHVAGSERLSRLEIGRLLAARHADGEARIEGTSLRTYQGAPRSPDTSLDSSKAEAILGRRLPAYSCWLADH